MRDRGVEKLVVCPLTSVIRAPRSTLAIRVGTPIESGGVGTKPLRPTIAHVLIESSG